ncbi:hypothetical protein QN277_009832 [Acacia crassicarpa]|uniref:Uncharacterized protein n=1 Tax=Acacia crassicarpa TaxID=499986 RepID=A0AAE1IPT8_9FABA|nr:hypothetical protein QN277_009832 [Acacia crassicarpa]
MNDFNSERSKPWNIYTTSEPGPPQPGVVDKEAPWRNFGTSMNAISFGFVATAILISMFLIMAIFEHLFKPTSQYSSPESLMDSMESGTTRKLRKRQTVSVSYASDLSVMMPGQQHPTFIAKPAPLPPCPREGVHWPSHEHCFVFD